VLASLPAERLVRHGYTDPGFAAVHTQSCLAGSRRGEWCSKAAGSDVTSATTGLMLVGLGAGYQARGRPQELSQVTFNRGP
jgi:hypothetical protein